MFCQYKFRILYKILNKNVEAQKNMSNSDKIRVFTSNNRHKKRLRLSVFFGKILKTSSKRKNCFRYRKTQNILLSIEIISYL